MMKLFFSVYFYFFIFIFKIQTQLQADNKNSKGSSCFWLQSIDVSLAAFLGTTDLPRWEADCCQS